jgi:hypothetical protein
LIRDLNQFLVVFLAAFLANSNQHRRLGLFTNRLHEHANLTAATSNLFDLIQSRQLVLYPDTNMRLAVSRAIIVESSRGWRLDKLKQFHKIDVVVALSMATLAAVRGQAESYFDLHGMLYGRDGNPDPGGNGGWHALQLMRHIQRYG